MPLWDNIWISGFAKHVTDDKDLFNQVRQKKSEITEQFAFSSNVKRFQSIFNITLPEFNFLSSADYHELNVSNIKRSVFLLKLFFFQLCVKFTTCVHPSIGIFQYYFSCIFPMKMNGQCNTWCQNTCTVWNYRHCKCPPIGIVNCVKLLHTRKRVFDVLLEELHISVKVILTERIKGCLERLLIANLEKYEYFVRFTAKTTQNISINPDIPNVSGWQHDS